MRAVEFEVGFRGWREQARQLLFESVPPGEVQWRPKRQFTLPSRTPPPKIKVPVTFLSIAKRVAYHRDEEKWTLLYRVLWRLTHENSKLLESRTDRDARDLADLDADVRQEIRRLRTRVHLRHWPGPDGGRLVAYYAPKHPVLGAWIPEVAARHSLTAWSIWTPDESRHWDLLNLVAAPGASLERGETLERFWQRMVPVVPHETTPVLCFPREIKKAVVLAPPDSLQGANGRVLARAFRLCGLSAEQTNWIWSSPDFHELGAALERGHPKPEILLVLGTEAAREVLGMPVVVDDRRGKISPTLWSDQTAITLDPATLLKVAEEREREQEFERWVSDLRKVVSRIASS